MSIRERIENGAKALDQKVPGWERRINPKRLNINCGRNCVLGQVFGSYTEGREALGLQNPGVNLGFCASFVATIRSGNRASEWTELNEEWKKFLAEREAERTVSAL